MNIHTSSSRNSRFMIICGVLIPSYSLKSATDNLAQSIVDNMPGYARKHRQCHSRLHCGYATNC